MSRAKEGRSDLGQRVLYVLLGAACVVLCYLVGAYWVGPWLHQRQAQSSEQAAPSEPKMVATPTPPSQQAFAPPTPPKLQGVQIRERDPATLPDTVRVIPPRGAAPPDESAPAEEPAPPTTLEEQPAAPPPPVNLWETPATPPRRPNEETAPLPDVQVPQTLDGTPATPGNVSSATPPVDTLYRVRLPLAYENREEADTMLRNLSEKGLPGAVVTDTVNGRRVFRVQLGVYRNQANAEKLAEQARQSGVPVEVAAPSR